MEGEWFVNAPFAGPFVAVSRLSRRDLALKASGSDLVSDSAMQSSVRLRHMLSALRRSLRSMALGVLYMLLASSVVSGLPVIAAKADASEAVVPRA